MRRRAHLQILAVAMPWGGWIRARRALVGSVWVGLSACGPSASMSMDGDGSTTEAVDLDTSADDGGVFEEPRPPDLGPDVVICGQPDETVGTDEEIAALAGCEVLVSGLVLDYPNVTDLSPLASVRILGRGMSSVPQNPGLATLSGLDNLEWVGRIRLRAEVKGEGLDNLENLSDLGNLTGVEGSLTLTELSSLTSVHGLERLRTVGSRLEITLNPALANLDGLGSLEWIGGDLLISYNESLESLEGLRALKQVGGDVWMLETPRSPRRKSRPSSNASRSEGWCTCHECARRGSNEVMSSQLLRIAHGLRLVHSAWLCIAVAVCASCHDGAGAEGDTGSGESTGVPTAPDLGDEAVVCGAPDDWRATVEQIAALEGCDVYEGSLVPHANVDLAYLSSLRVVRRHITFWGDLSLVDLEGFDDLEWVGSFHLSYTRPRDMANLRNLTGVEDYFELIAQEKLVSLEGLQGLRTVGGGLRLQSNPVLVDLEGLSGLEWIGGDLDISYNESLESLEGLSALQAIDGNVTIRQNPRLSAADRDAFLDRVEVGGVVNLD